MDSGGERDGLTSFWLLEQHRQQLSRGERFSRPSRRYEDLCLVAAICRAQRRSLAATAGSEDARSRVEQGLLGAVNLELTRLDTDIDSAQRWLRSGGRRKAEARARERFQAMGIAEAQLPGTTKPVSAQSPPRTSVEQLRLSGKITAYPGRPRKLKRGAHRRPDLGGINARAAWAVGVSVALAATLALVWSGLPLSEDPQLGSGVVGDEAAGPSATAPRVRDDDTSDGPRGNHSGGGGGGHEGRGNRSEDAADGGTSQPATAGAGTDSSARLVISDPAPAPDTDPPTPVADPNGEGSGDAPDSSGHPTGGGSGIAAGVRDELYDQMLDTP